LKVAPLFASLPIALISRTLQVQPPSRQEAQPAVCARDAVVCSKTGWAAKKLATKLGMQENRSIEFSVQKLVSSGWPARDGQLPASELTEAARNAVPAMAT
jgi:hypothetical protein